MIIGPGSRTSSKINTAAWRPPRPGRDAARPDIRGRSVSPAASDSRSPGRPGTPSATGLPDQLEGLLRVGLALPIGGAPAGDRAGAAGRVAGVAAPPAVPDHVVRQLGPVGLG